MGIMEYRPCLGHTTAAFLPQHGDSWQQEASITTLFRSEDGAGYTPVHLIQRVASTRGDADPSCVSTNDRNPFLFFFGKL